MQFGHAGALAHGEKETARAKNTALKEAGAIVPQSFNDLGTHVEALYQRLVQEGVISVQPEPVPPKVPIDYRCGS